MSRLFDGTDDVMTYALPASGAGPVNFGFGTQLVIARLVTAPTWASFIEIEEAAGSVEKGGFGRHSSGSIYTVDGANLRHSGEAGTGGTFTIGTGDNWALFATTKATGTSSPSFHKIPLATGTRSTHTVSTTLVNTASIASGRIRLGGDDDFANMRLAVAALLTGVVLTTTQLDTIAATKTTASILALASADSWVVDDADAFTNNLVAANTNRSDIVGTADDADDPADWVYGAGGATSSIVVPKSRVYNGLTMRKARR